MSNESHIPVGTVCAMFGLNPNTVRTWERRYQFPSPVRSAGGHRTYSPQDIEQISRIVELLRTGVSTAEAVQQVINAPKTPAPRRRNTQSPVIPDIINAARAYDLIHMWALARKALASEGYQRYIEKIAFPILNQLGHSWEVTGEGVAVEHAFTLSVSQVIAEKAQSFILPADVPVVTFACVPGEVHQLPLLHLCNLVAEQKLARPLILTAGLPIEETLIASTRAKASLILLSATLTPSAADTRQWISTCIEEGWQDRVVLAGPGFMRSRVYSEFPVKIAAGDFDHTVAYLKTVINQQDTKPEPEV